MKTNNKKAKILKKAEKTPLIREPVFALRRLKKRLMQSNFVYVSEEYNAIYFPINKVACTSLRNVFRKKGFRRESLKKIDLSNYKNKFAFVRNPYDRIVSCYEDKIKKPAESGVIAEAPKKIYEDMPFRKFIKSMFSIPESKSDKHFKSQYLFLTDSKGKLIPNFIGKFENLEEDYKKICKKIGIKNPPDLPHKRKSKRKNWRDYYDEETKKVVQERYKKDFELFGYSKEF